MDLKLEVLTKKGLYYNILKNKKIFKNKKAPESIEKYNLNKLNLRHKHNPYKIMDYVYDKTNPKVYLTTKKKDKNWKIKTGVIGVWEDNLSIKYDIVSAYILHKVFKYDKLITVNKGITFQEYKFYYDIENNHNLFVPSINKNEGCVIQFIE